jgi:hypothetical protein
MSVEFHTHGYFALLGLLQTGGAMYLIWILIGMPIASLLCAAFITMRDIKKRSANMGDHRTHSVPSVTALSKAANAGGWKSESAIQVLIGILSKPSDDGFRVTCVAKIDDKPWTRSKSEVWTLKRCSSGEVGLIKGDSRNHQAANSSDYQR